MRRIIFLTFLLVTTAAFAAEGTSEGSNQGLFSGTLADSIWTVVTFFVLLVILGKFAWKPLLKA